MSNIPNIIKYFNRSGVRLSLSEGKIIVQQDAPRSFVTKEEQDAIDRNEEQIVEYLTSLPTEEKGSEPRPTRKTEMVSRQSLRSEKSINSGIIHDSVVSFNGKTGDIEGVSSVCGKTGDVHVVCTFNGETGDIIGVNSVNGETGDVSFQYVSSIQGETGDVKLNLSQNVGSFNGATGDVFGVNSINGSTGDVTLVDLVGVSTFNGSSGGITTQSLVVPFAGISCDNGGTFGGDVSVANLYLAEDGEIGVVGESESITFNFSGGVLDINASHIDIKQEIRRKGDSDTKLDFTANQIDVHTGGFEQIGVSSTGGITFGGTGSISFGNTGDVTFEPSGQLVVVSGISADAGMTLGGDLNLGGNIVISEDNSIAIGGDTEKIVFAGSDGHLELQSNEVLVDRYITHRGDSNTNIEFQADQITLAAGGTDYIDITTAGTNFADTQVSRPKLKDYAETVHAVGNVNSSTAFDFENGNVQTVTVSGIDTGSQIVWSLSNPPASGIAGTMTVIFTNGLAHGDIAFHSSIKWPNDVAPTLTASGVDIISFLTIDAGTTYYGFVGGLNFS